MRTLLFFLAVVYKASAQTSDNSAGQFINPPPAGTDATTTSGLTFNVGETQQISWNTTFSTYTIELWQENPEGNGASKGPIIVGKYSALFKEVF